LLYWQGKTKTKTYKLSLGRTTLKPAKSGPERSVKKPAGGKRYKVILMSAFSRQKALVRYTKISKNMACGITPTAIFLVQF
jgi:hypothetical protein